MWDTIVGKKDNSHELFVAFVQALEEVAHLETFEPEKWISQHLQFGIIRLFDNIQNHVSIKNTTFVNSIKTYLKNQKIVNLSWNYLTLTEAELLSYLHDSRLCDQYDSSSEISNMNITDHNTNNHSSNT